MLLTMNHIPNFPLSLIVSEKSINLNFGVLIFNACDLKFVSILFISYRFKDKRKFYVLENLGYNYIPT